MKGRRFWAVALAACLAAGIMGCGDSSSEKKDPDAPAGKAGEQTGNTEEETAGGGTTAKDTLTIGMGNSITTLDFMNGGMTDSAYQLLSMIGATLLKQVDENNDGIAELVTEGSITESYEWDEDNLGITFHLREGIKMHDQTELHADDVIFCLEKYQTSKEYASVDFENTKAVDDYTVYFKLRSSGTVLLNRIATRPIYSKEACESSSSEGVFFTEGFVSCGPYKIDQWVSGDSVTLSVFDEYYGEKPVIDHVICRFFAEPSVAMMELQSGGVDMITSPDFTDYTSVEDGAYGDQFSTLYVPSVQTYSIYFDMASEKLQPLQLRQAIMYAMNREEISDGTFNGWGSLCYSMHGISYQDLTVYDKDSWPYKTNLEKAKELMKEAGLEDGVTLTLITHNASGYYQKIAEILANQLKEINVDVDINVYEPATFKSLQNATDGSWDLSITSPEVPYATTIGAWFADGYVDDSMHAGLLPAEGYQEAYELGSKLMQSTDNSEIKTMTAELEEKYFNEYLWWCPVQNSGVYTIMSTKLHDVTRMWTQMDITKAYFTE